MTSIVFDIETIPAQAPWVREELKAAVKAPGQFKKQDSIDQWLAENRDKEADEAWLKTSFDGGLGQIVCIGFAINDDAPISYTAPDLTLAAERKIIEDFFCVLTDAYDGGHGLKPLLIGHNHVAFDIPFVWKRAIVHGIKPPLWFPRNPKPWADSVFDTSSQWAGDRDRISMDRLCKILGIPGKDGMSGADVWPAIQRGEFDKVASYCRDDVTRTRAMWQRMTFKAPARATAPAAGPTAPWGAVRDFIDDAGDPTDTTGEPVDQTDAEIAAANGPEVDPFPAPAVESDSTPPAVVEPATLKIGTICTRLGFVVNAAFLQSLGQTPAFREKNAVLYRESQWPALKAALIRHIEAA